MRTSDSSRGHGKPFSIELLELAHEPPVGLAIEGCQFRIVDSCVFETGREPRGIEDIGPQLGGPWRGPQFLDQPLYPECI